jgi:hypothetical protein
MRQYGDFCTRPNLFAKFEQRHRLFEKDHNNTQAEKGVKHSRYDIRHTWNNFANTATELSLLAIALLSITASEAAVERTFSRQGLIHSKLRNLLSDESVRMQMFFSFNTRAMEQPNRHHAPSYKELDDGEAGKGTALLAGSESGESDEEEDEEMEEEEKPEEEKEGEGEENAEAMDEKQDEILEDFDRYSEKEEKEEKDEKKESDNPKKSLEQFVSDYVRNNRITKGFKWNEWKENQLQAELIDAGIKTVYSDVKMMIRRYVGDKSASVD